MRQKLDIMLILNKDIHLNVYGDVLTKDEDEPRSKDEDVEAIRNED
jgi:hypothetical protein